uniref:F-box domain-containing protein n=1 Tax=Parastrongyloides trichosuri TaxID=131310 RepID=A0A0N5A7B9_PARTI
MSILELPVELLIKILSYLECNDLRQIRYASKVFHVIIENNIHLMNKFEIHELTIISTHREKQEEKFDVEFSTYNGFNPIKEKRIKIVSFIFLPNLNSYQQKNIYSSCLHYYLTRCDINYLESISITVEGVNELFDVINQFITSKTPIKNINISVSKTPTPHSIETFITNTQNIEYLRINKLNFYPSISTITFPTFEKLRVLEIYDYFDNEQYIKEVMKLESLPVEILIKIFSYLEHHEIRNVKLTSRSLYIVVSKNIHAIKKHKLYHLKFGNVNDEEEEELFDVELNFHDSNALGYSRNCREFKFIKMDRLHNLLRRCDMYYLENLVIYGRKSKILFDILEPHLPENSRVLTLQIDTVQTSTPQKVEKFFNKLRSLESLTIRNLTFIKPKETINFPVFPNLSMLRIESTHYTEEDFIKNTSLNLINNCFKIHHFTFDTHTKNFSIGTIQALIEKKLNTLKCLDTDIFHRFTIILHSFIGISNENRFNMLSALSTRWKNSFTRWMVIENNVVAHKYCRRCGKTIYFNFHVL